MGGETGTQAIDGQSNCDELLITEKIINPNTCYPTLMDKSNLV
jgi:hypothetical protein